MVFWLGMWALSAADYALLPMPQDVKFGKSVLKLKSAAVKAMPVWEDSWRQALRQCGITIDDSSKYEVKGEIVDEIPGAPPANDEAYHLKVSKDGVNVKATSAKGIFWAMQTFIQLAEAQGGGRVPECEIVDWPAFPWRGFMIDTGRTFISLDELKREIKVMSAVKLNVFHWHLTENQAWRLESRIFPMLNDSANMERQKGMFYTISQAKELVEYAKAHNVMLVPEIDMPGHSGAFTRTFGYDMQSPEGIKTLKQLVDEACATFDVPYFHIGTDEVRFNDADFVPQMVRHVRSRGKKVISWNPGWQYKEGEIDLTTMWSYRGTPTPGVGAVDLRFHYINHFDTYADIMALYRSNVYGHKMADDGIVGVELALWNDRYIRDEASLIAQNSVYTSMMAVAERAWLGGGEEYFDRLGTNLFQDEAADFAAFADFERRMLWHKENTLRSIDIPYVKQTNVHWLITEAFPNQGDLNAVFPPETEGLKTQYVFNDSVYGTSAASGAGIYLRHVWGTLIPAHYPDPKPDHTAYAFTWVYAPRDMCVGLQAETQNYSRSESDLPPPQGKWDFKESKIWVNDVEIAPPRWTSSHKERSNETALENENMTARQPIAVNLRKGWNKVLLKLPVGQFSSADTRLVKWMFTFVFTTPDGKKAAPGLIYSPLKERG